MGIIIVFALPIVNDDFYHQLDNEYRNEKHQALKGFFIVLYMLVSIASFILFICVS